MKTDESGSSTMKDLTPSYEHQHLMCNGVTHHWSDNLVQVVEWCDSPKGRDSHEGGKVPQALRQVLKGDVDDSRYTEDRI